MEAEERPDGPNREEALGHRSLLVLYGTETGNSQEIAQEIGRAAERLRFQTDIEEMNDVPLVSPTVHIHHQRKEPTSISELLGNLTTVSSRKN